MRLFADDALIYRPIHTAEDHIILQNDLHTLERGATVWDMQFNPSKCYILSTKRDGDKSLHFYTLCGQVPVLQSVTNNPYLCVTLTDQLSFSTHVRKICAKVSHTLGFLNRNLKKIAHKSSEKLHILAVHGMKYTLAPLWHMEHAPYLEGERQQFPRPHYIDLYHFTSTNNIT